VAAPCKVDKYLALSDRHFFFAKKADGLVVRVQVSRKLKKALEELARGGIYSPEKFAAESALGKWYKEYVTELREEGGTPDDRYSGQFYDWVRERKEDEIVDYAQAKAAELIECHLR
jgi:hypothetical protein